MPDAEQRLIEVFRSVFPDLSPEEILQASTTSVGTWDSLATVTLISVIEEEFGITIQPEEYDRVNSFEFVREFVNGKTADV